MANGTTTSTCLTIPRCTSTARSLLKSPTKVTVYVGCDDRAKVWLNGEQLLTVMHPSNGTGVELPLLQGENRLRLVKIYNVTGGKSYSFSLTPNIQGGRSEDTSPEAMLWALVAEDFRNPADQQQIRCERQDGIWDQEWSAGDFRSFAGGDPIGDAQAGDLTRRRP